MNKRGLILLSVLTGIIFLLPYHSKKVAARGSQFEGILPPSTSIKDKEEEKKEELEEFLPPDLKLIINIPSRTVTLYDEGKEVYRYDVAVGQPIYKTPAGHQVVKRIVWNPWWIPPNSPWAKDASKTPPGPNNPLGPVKLIMRQGIRLHGTNKAKSVGRAASHGCLRMHNEEVIQLAWYIQKRLNSSEERLLERYKNNRRRSYHVSLNYPVNVDIIYEPVEIRNNKIIIYSDFYRWAKDPKTEILNALMKHGVDLKMIDVNKLSEISYPRKRYDYHELELTDLFATKFEKRACYAIAE